MNSENFDVYPKANIVEYRLTGAGGTAPSTLVGHKYAIRHFNIYLNSRGLMAFGASQETDICILSLFQQFATYLCEFAGDQNGDLISLGSALQYFSGAKTVTLNRWPNNLVMKVIFVFVFVKLY
jgi:hypothetical protein